MAERSVTAGLRGLLPGAPDWTAVRRAPRRDLLSGVTVAVVALPLALAFGVGSGLGAGAGLVTAVVAGALAAVFGGSNLQVTGPTGAMTVVLIPLFHQYGPDGVLTAGLLAGLILVVLAVARVGRLVRLLPSPVIEGFTAGIAVVIALQQFPAALGVSGGEHEKVWATAAAAVTAFADTPNWPAIALALGVAAVMLVGGRLLPSVPFSLVAVVAATAVAGLLHLDVARIGALPAGLPAPSLGFLDLATIPALLPSAVAVAALAALESLLSATVADGMTVDQRHDPDRELFGQGIANLAAPMFGGVPATGAIARTAVNARTGARSRLAALTHAAALTAIVYALAGPVGHIPLAALAGVLLATTIRMVEAGSLLALLRATRRDAAALVVTFVVTVVVDLVTAVVAGLAVAVVLALHRVALNAGGEHVTVAHDPGEHTAEERALLAQHIVAYRFDGPLFFATAHRLLLETSAISDVRVMILRMSRVSAIDATGAQVLDDAIRRLERRGCLVLLSGLRPGHDRALDALGVSAQLRAEGRVFPDSVSAIAHARAHLAGPPGHSGSDHQSRTVHSGETGPCPAPSG
ncbi:MAG: SulP family inorganic anion transporter [Pseudonocardia sp.]|uniref:SulP family inorganic anion transporter n=1 Tax=unclassified Pseudonocardia TaxID=2619320 RepID=UPI001ACC4938|nr:MULTISPECIES: SulP family inorganic anion transporter [unclassified Pseudonocardia]MBN9109070.1 SulP family inorganic anion transporter [Pseudonocardia sp.]